MNARRKRRRDLERWRESRPKMGTPWCGRGRVIGIDVASGVDFSAISAFAGTVFESLRVAAESFAHAMRALAPVFVSLGQFAVAFNALHSMPKEQPMTIAELYESLGGDGCYEPRARFTSEGGFTLN